MARQLMTLAAAAVLLSILAGCSALEARRRLQEYDEYFFPLIGKAQQADIVRKFGTPARKDRMGGMELWYYHIPSRDPRVSRTESGFEVGSAAGAESDIYDDLTIEFDSKGYLKSWRGYIQR